jgi:catechol 2,3-dioxygenase-like lactoylglutathione lyase family enzyme
MSVIKVQDVAFVRFAAPDLSKMRAFLSDFGLSDAEDAGDGVLRMRGLGDAPFIHETVLGEPGFQVVGMRADSVADLEALAAAEGATIEAAPGPGGGSFISLVDPNGFQVEVIAGQTSAKSLAGSQPVRWNASHTQARHGEAKRIAPGPAHVVRLGHVVLGVDNTEETWRWWQSRLGLILSDEVRAPNGALAAVFIRCDRGADPADHHTLNFAQVPGKPAGFHHVAFEVEDFDDLMAGHEHLKDGGFVHDWGIGRHILGSQVFDYWKDPWGHRVEHWTDGDLFAADVPTNVTDVPTMRTLARTADRLEPAQ